MPAGGKRPPGCFGGDGRNASQPVLNACERLPGKSCPVVGWYTACANAARSGSSTGLRARRLHGWGLPPGFLDHGTLAGSFCMSYFAAVHRWLQIAVFKKKPNPNQEGNKRGFGYRSLFQESRPSPPRAGRSDAGVDGTMEMVELCRILILLCSPPKGGDGRWDVTRAAGVTCRVAV